MSVLSEELCSSWKLGRHNITHELSKEIIRFKFQRPLDEKTVAKYMKLLEAGEYIGELDIVLVEGKVPVMTNGNHRLEAAKRLGISVPVHVKHGTIEDAQRRTLSINDCLRFTSADKLRAASGISPMASLEISLGEEFGLATAQIQEIISGMVCVSRARSLTAEALDEKESKILRLILSTLKKDPYVTCMSSVGAKELRQAYAKYRKQREGAISGAKSLRCIGKIAKTYFDSERKIVKALNLYLECKEWGRANSRLRLLSRGASYNDFIQYVMANIVRDV